MKRTATHQASEAHNHGGSSDIVILQASILADIPWLVHGFSTRLGGISTFDDSHPHSDLNLARLACDSAQNTTENRRRLIKQLRAETMQLVVLRQIHSDLIRVVDDEVPRVGDGLMTNRPGMLLSITVADCLPILIADIKQRVVAALHCGWRGTVNSLALKGVGTMRMAFGSQPADLRAAIGPAIRACCYKIGPEVKEEFEGQFPYAPEIIAHRRELPSALEMRYPRFFKSFPDSPSNQEHLYHSRLYLDLVSANMHQLRDAGLAKRHIYSQAPCTSCHPELFFSYRRDGERSGRMMGVIGIRESGAGS